MLTSGPLNTIWSFLLSGTAMNSRLSSAMPPRHPYDALPVVADPWAPLGLPRGSSAETVCRRRRELAWALHPDRSGGDAPRLADVNAAYDSLIGELILKQAFPGCWAPWGCVGERGQR